MVSPTAALLALWSLSVTASCTSCKGINAISAKCRSQETPYTRDAFYVGGQDFAGASGTLTINQIYVEKLQPTGAIGSAKPIIFFHGGGVSAITWLNTPDGRPGWVSYFIDQGHTLYLVDANSVGRSSANNPATFNLIPGTAAESLTNYFTDPSGYPQAGLHTQWPGTGRAGDPTFDQFKQALIPLTTNFVAQENAMRAAGCELLKLIGEKSYLISHSLGSRTPVLLSNDCPEYVAGNINLEAATSPFWAYAWTLGGFPSSPWGLTNTPVDYEPAVTDASELKIVSVGNETLAHRNCILQAEPARKLPKIASVPYVMVTGEASVHATYDHCVVDFLRQAGGDPEYIKLADLGIKGNGHFFHLELNNLEIAEIVSGWINKTDHALA
ncbi:Alpha/Beta hydrolase protein [Plectosphaerella plurivora]|uniref:Alpha/Beta hydrolase protein n=1 Tax=Plectosphaerella plurivora TaxID=936078 RepID=A0A9P8VHJ0_9PEZI|nr:Alpha/Beta hydrolase protein [Plectosphaerella plurivora]